MTYGIFMFRNKNTGVVDTKNIITRKYLPITLQKPRMSRYVCRSSIHYVSNNRWERSSFESQLQLKTAYAINQLYVTLNDDKDDPDAQLYEFVQALKTASPKFYNLKNVSINAPTSIMTGEIAQELMSMPGTFTELNMTLFAFHTPLRIQATKAQGNYVKIRELDIKFTDGYAFPNSGSDFLESVATYKPLTAITIRNESPHMPILRVPNMRTRFKMFYTKGFR